MKKNELISGFGDTVLGLLKSDSYSKYCNKIFGYPIRLFSMLIKEDIDDIIDLVNNKNIDIVCDFGCGTGELIKLISDITNKKCIGIDISEKSIDELNKRNTSLKINYICDDLDICNNINVKFDIVFLIDSLYFVNSYEKAISNIISILNNNGKIVIYYSEYAFKTKNDDYKDYKKTKLGKVLETMNIEYKAEDISEREIRNWENSLNAAKEFEELFIKEGALEILEGNRKEADYILNEIKNNGGRRYRYIINNV